MSVDQLIRDRFAGYSYGPKRPQDTKPHEHQKGLLPYFQKPFPDEDMSELLGEVSRVNLFARELYTTYRFAPVLNLAEKAWVINRINDIFTLAGVDQISHRATTYTFAPGPNGNGQVEPTETRLTFGFPIESKYKAEEAMRLIMDGYVLDKEAITTRKTMAERPKQVAADRLVL